MHEISFPLPLNFLRAVSAYLWPSHFTNSSTCSKFVCRIHPDAVIDVMVT
ncbi:hypothetical protein S1OALGB6SA_2415 [Olavius algarvensis spirochete endosymbiont]|nr:hypothetical protein S1OALGB6SA_2415 [Olavius algarvensis spirochete endosymbiont]